MKRIGKSTPAASSSRTQFLVKVCIYLKAGDIIWWGHTMLDQGVWAEVRVSGEHLRLFSEDNAIGVQASVYNVNTKSWIAPSESVDDIEQGKAKAEAYAQAYLKNLSLELPRLEWKKSRSA